MQNLVLVVSRDIPAFLCQTENGIAVVGATPFLPSGSRIGEMCVAALTHLLGKAARQEYIDNELKSNWSKETVA